jgi:hypothetical protein
MHIEEICELNNQKIVKNLDSFRFQLDQKVVKIR